MKFSAPAAATLSYPQYRRDERNRDGTTTRLQLRHNRHSPVQKRRSVLDSAAPRTADRRHGFDGLLRPEDFTEGTFFSLPPLFELHRQTILGGFGVLGAFGLLYIWSVSTICSTTFSTFLRDESEGANRSRKGRKQATSFWPDGKSLSKPIPCPEPDQITDVYTETDPAPDCLF